MKPYVISHMMMSIDGRIDCDMTEQIDPSDSYYEALDSLRCPSMLMGRVTMQMHYADSAPFLPADASPIGKTAFHKAVETEGYIIALDTHGRLRWSSTAYDGKPLLVVVSEACPKETVENLTAQGISWIAVGKTAIDLEKMLDILRDDFGVERLAVTGGGHINGSFLELQLFDEVSVMIGPGIDGRAGMASVYDGIADQNKTATLFKLETVDRLADTVWLRYKKI